MCHTKHFFSWEFTRVITLLQNEPESELAPEEGVAGSGHQGAAALGGHVTTPGGGELPSNLVVAVAP